ncbi:polysaccharide deacetylase family protein [Streptomyces sp. WAC05374]|uniref:polysaccharide deacetylase family protein n=1 Tax=Streptomyces sp. WAC05374 TaxID=2487420 RepID=UPI000F861015|nr:polysaccharide deacetylase family protein [Streptomyces sp. WAC05374]RST13308.1 polysaccharide deacetylase family protein [Streptomyces sp. WAC05374]TDF37063.1 polysaccharide deacetylase family protein [Streptomyces sp. WAC05374]TDF45039.1 polysaccharide deacetylase family protein [Streptomyces sp. WAC05374]TDF46354.1 polysaccharide deacetylase family protein [Streptomyces sp. WAC05374]
MGKYIVGAAALTAVALLISGCDTQSAPQPAPTTVAAVPPKAPDKAPDPSAAYAKWGLKPFAAPPAPPAVKPVKRADGGPVPVISEIPTKDKVVFLTFDDGAEKDPEFVAMMRDLKVPFTMFLTDSAISRDYGYFTPLAALGAGVANHTLTHPDLRTLDAAAQKREICGQQERLERAYGTTPRLFRPPYGNWNEDTRAAAAQCGVDAIVLWRESMQITDMQYQRADHKLRPGDIILAHFRGPEDLKGTTMTQMTATMLRRVQEQGFTVARLEDYV